MQTARGAFRGYINQALHGAIGRVRRLLANASPREIRRRILLDHDRWEWLLRHQARGWTLRPGQILFISLSIRIAR